ncbi:MAG: hypothetical protein MSR67_05745 [Oscillospiraceae bacterium]|nr:hypothetical protein [Oscillospiraceae bacterium]
MVHSLRKYLSNRGSALFMVISTMTALMITCMAMYFAVVSSRSAQYAVFNQQQSYQTARSTSEIIMDGLANGTLNSEGGKGLRDLLVSTEMNVGDVITTKGNGFISLNPTGTKDDDADLGAAYDVTITRLNDELVDGEENYTYDIAVTASVNGNREVIHTIVHVNPPKSDPLDNAASQVFAATGYADQDTYLDGGAFITDMFIDTENAVVNAYPGMQNKFTGNLTAGGSLQINGYLSPNPDKYVEWYIRNKLYESPDKNYVLTFSDTSARSRVYVGGDLDMGDNWGGISNADIYVNGNFYYGQSNFSNCRVFVHGNVYVRKAHRDLSAFPIYCDGNVIEINGGIQQGSIKGTWEANNNLPSGALTRHEAMSVLDEKTATGTFYKWEINDKYKYVRTWDDKSKKWKDTSEIDTTYVPELDTTHGTEVYKTLHWDASTYPVTLHPVETLTYGTDGTGCIIKDTTFNRGNGGINDFTLIIDTGDDPDNVYTLRVLANRDMDGDGKNETFSWFPENAVDGTDRFKILVKGRGSVVIDVPEGVTYQDMHRMQVSHYNWWVLAGGTISENNGEKVYSRVEYKDDLAQFVHRDCGGSSDACTYTEVSSDKDCTICGGKKNAVTCDRHEYTFYYCPSCEKTLKDNDFAGACINRVDREAIDKYLASHSNIKSRMEKDSKGKLVYPTINIFLVSVEESADIRLSITKNGDTIIQNAFFGFIYAPYMTFKGYGSNSGGGYIRFFGGATVSDFIFQDSMSFVTCWPEKLPEDLMSPTSRAQKLSGVNKSWKISLGSY